MISGSLEPEVQRLLILGVSYALSSGIPDHVQEVTLHTGQSGYKR